MVIVVVFDLDCCLGCCLVLVCLFRLFCFDCLVVGGCGLCALVSWVVCWFGMFCCCWFRVVDLRFGGFVCWLLGLLWVALGCLFWLW